MKIFRYLLVLLFVLGCAKDEPVPTTGNLRGKITDAETSSPLKDVNVEIGGSSYTTGSDGSYFFNNLIAQTYSVSVSKTGYIADSKSVQVRAEQTITSDFVLSKNLPQIQPSSVTITDEDGSKSVTLRNTQTDPIGFSTQVSKSWIEVSPSTGSIAANSQTIITITINFEEIDFGEYNENIVINVSGSSLSIPVVVSKSQPSFINILQPQENGIYAPEEIMSITWESNLEGTVDINLLRSGNSSIFRVISEEVQNNEGGSFNWTIPEIDQGQYRVQVVSNEDVSISDITGNFIIGLDPSIPFIEQDQEFSYVEAQEVGFIIGTLSASDDIGIEQFEIVSGNSQGYFEVSPTGKILLTESGATSPANDFEDEPNQFTLSIKAIDGDSNESSAVDVIINVVDSDDQAPVITEGQSFTYSEGQPLEYVMGTVEAEDNVAIKSFIITSGNTQGYFAISDLGRISLTEAGVNSPANDYENEPNAFTIKVTATDQSGNVSDEVSIDIIVVDIDDIPPTINDSQSFDYDEGQSSGYQIGTVVAQDNIGVVQFIISGRNDNGYYSITNNGQIQLTNVGAATNAASNDFEISPNLFNLEIIAIDEVGNESTPTSVTLNVIDKEEAESGLILFLDSKESSSYNGGDVWYDLSGNGNNGKLSSVSIGAVSGVMTFDGVDDEVIIESETIGNIGAQSHTIIAWVKPNSLSEEDVFGTRENSQSGALLMLYQNNVRGHVWSTEGDSNTIDSNNTSSNVRINNWVQIAQKVNWEEDTISIYVNGELNTSKSLNGVPYSSSNFKAYIGSRGSGASSIFDGQIGQIQVYTGAVSSTVILENYESYKDVFSTNARFFKDSNGVTIKCENCAPGDSGSVDGITYTAVSRDQLDALIASNADVTKVCTSLITDMSYLFEDRTNFNQDISSWDTSNVNNMKMMFRVARAFNQNISSWDTSKVTTMEGMFYGASGYNKPLNSWDVSNVQDFQSMFSTADLFNQPIGDWDTSSATNISDMFFSADRFNQNINDWDVSNVVYMHGVFWGAHAFNQPLNKWDTSNVITTTYMFAGAYEGYSTFNQDISSWDVSNVEEMQYMFSFNSDFNKPLNGWDVSKVRNMERMFSHASSFNQDLDDWNTESLIQMNALFERAGAFNGRLNTWKISKVTDLTDVFYFAQSFNQPLDNWDISGVRALNGTFSTSGFNQNINNWDTSEVVEMTNTFSFSPFNQPLDQWDTSMVTRLYGMFMYASDFNQNIDGWNVSNVYDFIKMFEGAESFNQPLNNWNTQSAYSFLMMFQGASSFNQPLNNWNTSNVVSMQKMFRETESFDQPLNNWNTSKVEDMVDLFYLSNFNSSIGSWDVSNVKTMSGMFDGNQAFNQDISNWDVRNVTQMQAMFKNTLFNINISNWDVSNVENMNYMFEGAKFNQDISVWCVENITTAPDNFASGGQLQSDYYPVWGTCPGSLEQGLIAYYSLNGNTNDSGPNNIDGQLYNGAGYTQDKDGNSNRALILDGVDDYLDIGSNSLFNLSDGFSMSFWIKVDERPDSSVQVFTHPNNEQFQITYTSEGQIKFFVKTISNDWISSTADLPLSVFSNIVVSYAQQNDGEAPRGNIYLNGELVEGFVLSKSLISPGDPSHSRNIIGGIIRPNENVLIEAFKGVIDEVGLWRRGLTAPEVRQLFDSN